MIFFIYRGVIRSFFAPGIAKKFIYITLIKMNTTTKKYLAFASYDFSNSGYVIMFQSFLFPVVLTSVLASTSFDANKTWAWLVMASSIISVVGAPFLGKLADKIGKWKVFSLMVALAGLLAALTINSLSAWILIIGFLIFNTAFEFSQSLYDSFLRNVEQDEKATTSLSTFAWGVGYLGGAIFSIIYLFMQKNDISNSLMLTIFAFLFLVLSIPAIISFKKIEREKKIDIELDENLKDILHPKNPVPWVHLFIYWVIADCVAAAVYFLPLYLQQELKIEIKTVGMLLLGAQVLAFPATIFMGKVANKIGRIRTIKISLLIWGLSLFLLLLFAKGIKDIIPIMIMVSFVIGTTQSILRAHFATRVSVDKSGEGLGFYAVAQKSASIISPALIILVTTITNSIKPAFVVLLLLVTIGFLLAPQLNKKQLVQ
ncbi:hypothetical protein CO134_04190 [Candidatus Kuenenbacteria bacterium CG_4_9_14_3_um_filter_39_14]|uniref:Major facilitator superfamily (MFS) profile domain-containing protein n=6 Tax=Candidatus Kueneniibacteriota TaxID=1752740 RepID=A0A2M7IL78_9BACT|nr:MAG: hypothetical protein COX28_00665 [Candidatus Kuenenbacteria bacterium CG23_combo_of_CG06-09_8_20_14_all_39_39]PIP75856.1 MAG: hypothetical protein COW86_01375 [Candidatus Kuenenbacteria bacterium CG22_combo_CG10-13_8_21_14_all_39_9]PIW95586.1 MAG: hypothetical protein COZ84_02730 [Candidatus Kuenenbacteria bacterium CG_4_8_14_3_um_filter_39_15]PIX92173.1 MAG: hypothetical protein COZ26_03200 [Candidatus Kuenenbacteria bacterium CG_4_10_14_3_um_filter_39_14]PJA91669.1 MAG: hypothetical p